MAEVRIDVEEDGSKVGYALVTFHGFLGSVARPRLLVARRSNETPYLGLDGLWQASPAAFDVEVLTKNGQKTVMRVGPQVADRIPFEMQVRLQIEGTDIYGAVFWPDVPPEPKPFRDTIATPGVAGEFDSDSSDQAPGPAPFDLPVVPPIVPLPSEPTVTDPIVPSPIVPKLPQKKQASGRKAWALLLLLLTAAGAGTYFYLEAVDKPQQREISIAERFEQLKVNDPDGSGLLELSRDAFAGNDTSIGSAALRLAVERKNQTAKLELAKYYDPRTFQADRVPAANANDAARAYWELATEHQNMEAATLLSGLCAMSGTAAATSNPAFADFRTGFYCENLTGP